MKLRLATETDIPRLVELWLEMMRDHEEFDPRVKLTTMAGFAYQSYLLLHVRGEKSIVVLAEQYGKIAGFCCGYVSSNLPMFAPAEFGYISDLYVLPPFRCRGIGTGLLARTLDFFKEQGATEAHLQVYHRNVAGKAFWKARGFDLFFDRMSLSLKDR